MTTNIERAIEIIEDEHDPNFGPIDAPSLIYALNDAGLLMQDEDECLPSWVYDHPDVCTNPHRMGGQPCIRGTRVQVDIIFNLMDGPDGCTDGEITEFYPSVPTDAINRLRTAREERNNG